MSSIVVRPLTTEEYPGYFRLADATFSDQPSDENAQGWQLSLIHSPNFRPEQVRGAFRNGQFLGAYIIHERLLCMGAARISTGCIGAVVTLPSYRKQGVGTALLQDAYDFAQKNNHPLLLLDGIPNFYFRYGYIDMFDMTTVEVECAAILAQAPTGYHVRPATIDDAADILALYNHHYSAYTGSFERSLELQMHRLRYRSLPPVVAISPAGHVAGYLYHNRENEGREIAANDWEVLLTLLQYHAHSLDGDNAPKTLHYFLPPDAPMTQWMIDSLEAPDTSQWHLPVEKWAIRTLTYHHRFTGWMGCLVNFSALMHALQPELLARWQRSLAQWHGSIALTAKEETCTLHIDGSHVRLTDDVHSATIHLELTPQALIQGIFGYRPLPNVASMADNTHAVLSILFPQGHTWLPGTDWF